MTTLWTWLVLGLVPYYINMQRAADEQILQIQALFWSLNKHKQHHGQIQWTLHIPLIKRFQQAVWAVLRHPRGDDAPYKCTGNTEEQQFS